MVFAAFVLIGCLVGSELTKSAMEHLPFLAGQNAQALVDQRPWQTAQALAPLAMSSEEVKYAREAERLADHEVDQAFAQALRQAKIDTPVLSGKALQVSQKIAAMQETVKQDRAEVDRLTAAVAGPNGGDLADDLEVEKAQAGLDSDQLNDAVQELARVSGDKRTEIQQELATREAEMKKYDSGLNNTAQTAVVASARYGTLYGRLRAWFSQRERYRLLLRAQRQAERDRVDLEAEDAKLQARASSTRDAQENVAATSGSKADRLAAIGRMSSQRAALGILADREQTQLELAQVYQQWAAQVLVQHRIVMHLMLGSFAWIAALLLTASLVGEGSRRVLARLTVESRTLAMLRTVVDLGIEILAFALILIVVFGLPKQMPTILGFATAGLTVVFQDFILGFFGWFVLMGRNGIRVGDWVEIDGVGGEVAEIGLFRTALLETGNWTDKGHPTGRLITYVNKFAVTGQYFNFSTAGQWLWDEIKVNVPQSEDSYKMIDAIRQVALEQTEKDAKQAEIEWQRVASHKALTKFNAAPAVDLRPAASGIDVVVRYVTRASERFEVRNKIFEAVVQLMNAKKA